MRRGDVGQAVPRRALSSKVFAFDATRHPHGDRPLPTFVSRAGAHGELTTLCCVGFSDEIGGMLSPREPDTARGVAARGGLS